MGGEDDDAGDWGTLYADILTTALCRKYGKLSMLSVMHWIKTIWLLLDSDENSQCEAFEMATLQLQCLLSCTACTGAICYAIVQLHCVVYYRFTVWFTTLRSSEVDTPYGRLKAHLLSVED